MGSNDERFGPERLAEVAAARDRGELDYLDFVSGRWARFTELKDRRDLVQLHDVAEWLSRGPHPVAYDDVLAQFLLSARHGEFGTIGARRKVKGLLYLEPDSAPRGKRRLRLTSLEIETLRCVRYLWGSRSMLEQWLENRGWSVAPWLATAPSSGRRQIGEPRPRRGRSPAPHWLGAHKFIDDWLDDNGHPAPGDGGQAVLEKAVGEWLIDRVAEPPTESTIRDHVKKRIEEHKAKVGADKGR